MRGAGRGAGGGVTVARELRYDLIGNLEQVLSGATVLEELVDRGAAGPQKLDHSTGGETYDYDHRGRQTRAGSRTPFLYEPLRPLRPPCALAVLSPSP